MKRLLILFCLSWVIIIPNQAQRHYKTQSRVCTEKNIKPQIPLQDVNQKLDSSIKQSEVGLMAITTTHEKDEVILEEEIAGELIVQPTNKNSSSSFSEQVLSHSKSRIKSHRFVQHRIPKGVRKTNDVISVLFWVFGILFSSALGGFIANVIVTGLSTISIVFLALSIVFLLAMVALIIISVLNT